MLKRMNVFIYIQKLLSKVVPMQMHVILMKMQTGMMVLVVYMFKMIVENVVVIIQVVLLGLNSQQLAVIIKFHSVGRL